MPSPFSRRRVRRFKRFRETQWTGKDTDAFNRNFIRFFETRGLVMDQYGVLVGRLRLEKRRRAGQEAVESLSS